MKLCEMDCKAAYPRMYYALLFLFAVGVLYLPIDILSGAKYVDWQTGQFLILLLTAAGFMLSLCAFALISYGFYRYLDKTGNYAGLFKKALFFGAGAALIKFLFDVIEYFRYSGTWNQDFFSTMHATLAGSGALVLVSIALAFAVSLGFWLEAVLGITHKMKGVEMKAPAVAVRRTARRKRRR
ncbi:MAG: hypothetical protein V1811_02065 [Candidatus Micrarchaeota archaeon]